MKLIQLIFMVVGVNAYSVPHTKKDKGETFVAFHPGVKSRILSYTFVNPINLFDAEKQRFEAPKAGEYVFQFLDPDSSCRDNKLSTEPTDKDCYVYLNINDKEVTKLAVYYGIHKNLEKVTLKKGDNVFISVPAGVTSRSGYFVGHCVKSDKNTPNNTK